MNVTVLACSSSGTKSISIALRPLLISGVIFLLTASGLCLWYGYQAGIEKNTEARVAKRLAHLSSELRDSRQKVTDIGRGYHSQMDTLSKWLGEMKAKSSRLEALSSRLASAAQLDSEAFDLTKAKTPLVSQTTPQQTLPEFAIELESLAARLAASDRRLFYLDKYLTYHQLDAAAYVSGMPVKQGYLSSHFGHRTDPITGHKKRHKGIDFAGREGVFVYATASGVIVWAGSRTTYGQLVEVDHGNGMITRYAHCSKIMVEVGDVVTKGQTIALMGRTGRTTGHNLHYEVLKDGKVVNPKKYLAHGSHQKTGL